MRNGKWTAKDQVYFFENLSDLLETGYSLQDALNTLRMLRPNLEKDLEHIMASLESGSDFIDVIKPYVNQRIKFQLSFIAIHGNLLAIIREVGRLERQAYQQTQKFKALLLYPFVLILLTGSLGGGLALFFYTHKLQVTSNFNLIDVAIYGGGILGVLILICFSLWFKFKRVPTLKRWRLAMQIPFISSLLRNIIGYYMAFNVGILLRSGVNLATIVKRSSQYSQKTFVGALGSEMQIYLEHGSDLIVYLKENNLLPDEAQTVLSTGKTPLMMGKDLEFLAELKRRRVIHQIERCLNLIQPVCFILIGVVVIGLYVSFMLPLYSEMGEIKTW